MIAVGCSKSSSPPSETNTQSVECGVERWQVKTLTDADAASIDWTPIASSIRDQDTNVQVSVQEETPRMKFEEQVVSIPCTIVAFKQEDDSDIHLVLRNALADSMIAEIPNLSCAEAGTSPRAADFQSAHDWVTSHLGIPKSDFKSSNISVTVTGVLFQDFPHGQKGHANNYREIHPVIRIE
ncbi:MAG TPA: hypothetical protein VG537_06740 [Candidatus Kapabacteria bacterium]|jgi:hypothetical protein|nr:hypothetical protein [Candidatus Kapabacteria bacterium]